MDPQTLAAYTSDPGRFAAGFETLAPGELPYLALAGAFFHAGQPVADISCGSGRDAAWLQARGYVVTAYDGSAAMLAEAHRLHPELPLAQAALPDLAEIAPDIRYPNILCSAVLMHLPAEQLLSAVFRLAEPLAPGGRLPSGRGCAQGRLAGLAHLRFRRQRPGRRTPHPGPTRLYLRRVIDLYKLLSTPAGDILSPRVWVSGRLAVENPC